MGVVITVVAHKHDGVLPTAGIFVVGVADGLVGEGLRIIEGTTGQTTYGHIGSSGICVSAAALLLYLFPVIEQTEIVVADITIYRTE